MLFEYFLSFVGAVERLLRLRIGARSGVIAAYDEVRNTMILADKRVPDGFAWSAHAHGEGQQRKFRGRLRELRKQQLIATDASVVIHVAGLGHAHDGMNQQIGFDLLGGAECQFHVRAMHRVACLEGDHFPPAHARKFCAHFGGRQTQVAKIVVRRNLRRLDFASDVPRIRLIDGVISPGMRGAGGGENRFCFGLTVRLPDLFDVQHCQHHAFGIAKRNFARPRR